MESYTIQIWIMLFFIYSFLGWIWETCYVSSKEKKLVNRGFLYSPLLPIYGFGAVVVLITTLRFRGNVLAVYFVGSFSSTLLELFTGVLMESIFKTRYWDYSYKKHNYKGYICLTSTIAWGFFSLIMLNYINVPIEYFVMSLNGDLIDYMILVLLVVFILDVTKSIKNAFDLRKLLETMANSNEKVDELITEVRELVDRVDINKEEFKLRVSNVHNEIVKKEFIRIEKIVDEKNKLQTKLALSNIFDKLSEVLNYTENYVKELDLSKNEKILEEMNMFKSKIEERQKSISNIDLNKFSGAIKQLKRNPNAGSKNLEKELEKAKKL